MPRHVMTAGIGVMALVLAAAGCARQAARPAVDQASWFPHAPHVEYFTSGRHRSEKVAMHAAIFGDDAPEAVGAGRCGECHDDLADRTACATCHVMFQHAAARERTEGRACIACHRGTWSGRGRATPTSETCLTCHDPDRRPASAGPAIVRVALVRSTVPDARVTGYPANVYFSHSAHVRFAAVSCARCHEAPGATVDRAATRQLMTMTACLRCHQDNGASTDCLVCHR
jgi:menaquinone reductase, multiheme cytochrome c subunit